MILVRGLLTFNDKEKNLVKVTFKWLQIVFVFQPYQRVNLFTIK